jgi:hypothetical protein
LTIVRGVTTMAFVFPIAIVGLVLSLICGFSFGHHFGTFFDLRALPILVPCLALVASSYIHWARHPDGIRDHRDGGSVHLKRRSATYLEWNDWALLFTHRGFIDGRANLVRVERRLLMGLIPLSRVMKSTLEFKYVRLDEQLQTTTRERREFAGTARTEEPSYYTLTLVLANRAGEQLDLLDLNTPLGNSAERDFMRDLKKQVEELVEDPAVSGVGGRRE